MSEREKAPTFWNADNMESVLLYNFVKERVLGNQLLQRWGLPTIPMKAEKLTTIMQNKDLFLAQFPTNKYYMTVNTPNDRPLRFLDKTWGEIEEEITATLPAELMTSAYARMYPSYSNRFGGNIVISDNQNIHVEIVTGSQALLASGEKIAEYVVQRKEPSKTFHYYENSRYLGDREIKSKEIRGYFYSAIQKVPHHGQFYLPGYYEFAIVDQNRAVFWEYRGSSLWKLQTKGKNVKLL